MYGALVHGGLKSRGASPMVTYAAEYGEINIARRKSLVALASPSAGIIRIRFIGFGAVLHLSRTALRYSTPLNI